ncbi:MAG: translesion error-prone DNA polymerase V autoproteolytic subunit [Herminiimonas sp.]|uniref:LexA family protein n=1 Tax=Herminiimonas sp. TaxID=1926289 RepID=UPI0027283EFD|nr:translesion error-prone DNA polymerase V autoproteolytic subunit [Herminiimonas sp.]MDO9419979.1 translesion error-prone DNA polymerase V autoproteolytic subunit [Herminiimonas sp.]
MITFTAKAEPLLSQFVRAAIDPPVVRRPLALCPVPAGFASPARDYKGKSLDLNELLIRNSPATFFWNVSGFSMRDEGINDGDIVVVDRSVEAKHGHIVVAEINGEVTVKKLYKRGRVVELRPANPDFQPICFKDGDELIIWGVVTSVIHIFKS